MSTLRVCSGFSPAGRVQYGERFLRSFDRYWPAGVELSVWVEEPFEMPRGACRDLWAIPGALEFAQRHRDNLAAQGREPQPCWKDRERRQGYSFRTDAYKFWKQILIPEAAAADLADGDVLVWLDGDVETTRPVPYELVAQLLGVGDVAFLGREPKHSEIGFWAVRLNDETRQFLHDIAQVYRSDAVFGLPQWHSAYVWDHVRRQADLVERNLTNPAMPTGHVWPHTQLGRYMRHDKGGRKGVGGR